MLWRVFGKRCSSLKAGTTMESSRISRHATLPRVLRVKGGELICTWFYRDAFAGRFLRPHILSPNSISSLGSSPLCALCVKGRCSTRRDLFIKTLNSESSYNVCETHLCVVVQRPCHEHHTARHLAEKRIENGPGNSPGHQLLSPAQRHDLVFVAGDLSSIEGLLSP